MKFPLVANKPYAATKLVVFIIISVVVLLNLDRILPEFAVKYIYPIFAVLYLIIIIAIIIKKPATEGEVIFSDENITIRKKGNEQSFSYNDLTDCKINSYDGQAMPFSRKLSKGVDNYLTFQFHSEYYFFYIEDDLKFKVLKRFINKKI